MGHEARKSQKEHYKLHSLHIGIQLSTHGGWYLK